VRWWPGEERRAGVRGARAGLRLGRGETEQWRWGMMADVQERLSGGRRVATYAMAAPVAWTGGILASDPTSHRLLGRAHVVHLAGQATNRPQKRAPHRSLRMVVQLAQLAQRASIAPGQGRWAAGLADPSCRQLAAPAVCTYPTVIASSGFQPSLASDDSSSTSVLDRRGLFVLRVGRSLIYAMGTSGDDRIGPAGRRWNGSRWVLPSF
jgi:hypothetical protein